MIAGMFIEMVNGVFHDVETVLFFVVPTLGCKLMTAAQKIIALPSS